MTGGSWKTRGIGLVWNHHPPKQCIFFQGNPSNLPDHYFSIKFEPPKMGNVKIPEKTTHKKTHPERGSADFYGKWFKWLVDVGKSSIHEFLSEWTFEVAGLARSFLISSYIKRWERLVSWILYKLSNEKATPGCLGYINDKYMRYIYINIYI